MVARMAVRVQFATAADGVRIAFAAVGTGPAIVHLPPVPLRHLVREWQLPEDRRWMERLGRGRSLIQYDPRGLGLSQRDVGELSFDAATRDLDAVLDAAGVRRAALFACVNAAPAAIAYAARRPERVSHLILWCAAASARDAFPAQVQTLAALIDRDWDLATEAVAHVLVGWSAGEAASRYAEFIRACLAPADAQRLLSAVDAFDARELLPRVRVPTLVMHLGGITWIPLARAMELASRIPGARLMVLDGSHMRPGAGDVETIGRAVDDFLGVPPDEQSTIHPSPQARSDAGPHSVFRREGEYWTLTFAGQLCRLRDSKGLRHIAHLLREPEQPVPALVLVGALDGPVDDPSESPAAASLNDAGVLLDAQAKAAYRARIEALRDTLAEAEESNDLGRATAARAELDFLARQLSAAVGLGGRDRRAASAAERARLTVRKRIRSALTRIRDSHPALGEHLGRALRTGHLCTYAPAPEARVRWEL